MIQRESVFPIKLSRAPGIGAMTRRALRTELARMGRRFCMAGNAISRRTLEHIIHMTAFAAHFPVPTVQLEGG